MDIFEYMYLQSLLYEINDEYVIFDSNISSLYKCSLKTIKKILRKNDVSSNYYF